jgi:hypothetical protein
MRSRRQHRGDLLRTPAAFRISESNGTSQGISLNCGWCSRQRRRTKMVAESWVSSWPPTEGRGGRTDLGLAEHTDARLDAGKQAVQVCVDAYRA